jgi:hypothetical protein
MNAQLFDFLFKLLFLALCTSVLAGIVHLLAVGHGDIASSYAFLDRWIKPAMVSAAGIIVLFAADLLLTEFPPNKK